MTNAQFLTLVSMIAEVHHMATAAAIKAGVPADLIEGSHKRMDGAITRAQTFTENNNGAL